MTPFWQDEHLTLYGGDCRAVLATMAPESVHCVVTSPPYWGLRDYGVGGQLGLEPTPEEYVANMVAVFREVRRVLRADGTLWLNLGDSYNSAASNNWTSAKDARRAEERDGSPHPRQKLIPGMKVKDLVGIPWRVAFALQADGWYLRSDIIWSKPNPMPESVTDRPIKAHEYLFLLSKQPRYYFDADAVREPFIDPAGEGRRQLKPDGWATGKGSHSAIAHYGSKSGDEATELGAPAAHAGRNLRSVWTIATEPYPGAHFATFPRKLVEPCVKAGTSERGVCPECGAPWVRVVSVEQVPTQATNGREKQEAVTGWDRDKWPRTRKDVATTGWRPTCKYDRCPSGSGELSGRSPAEPVPAVVLDPFAGSGTTLLVAQSLGRRGVGIDLSPEYLKQALARNAQTPLGLVG